MGNMEKEIHNIVKKYKIDTTFDTQLNDTIHLLKSIRKKHKKQIKHPKELFNLNAIKSKSKVDNEYMNDVLLCLSKLNKTSVTYTSEKIGWSNGHDDYSEYDLYQYTITYKAFDTTITVFIEYTDGYIDELITTACWIKFDDWFQFTITNHGDELGYYEENIENKIEHSNTSEMKRFYEQFDTHLPIDKFYANLIATLCVKEQKEFKLCKYSHYDHFYNCYLQCKLTFD